VIVDTAGVEKAVVHPTDSRALKRCREQLVMAAAQHGLKLWQNCNREAPRLAGQIGRYAHAKQYKRMKHALRTLRSRVGRMTRDVKRKLSAVATQNRAALEKLIGRAKRIPSQKPKNQHKLYALHAPEVECLAKGKARKPYEFGVKVSTIHNEGLVLGALSMPGNPYDAPTLAETPEQAEILSSVRPQIGVVDRASYHSQRRGASKSASDNRIPCGLKFLPGSDDSTSAIRILCEPTLYCFVERHRGSPYL